MKIALDAMGGDNAPDVVIRGSKDALARQTNIEKLFLVGDEKIIKAECEKHGLNDRRVQIVHATEVIAMHESALKALRSKKNSSVSVATDLVKSGEADAVPP